MLVGLNHPRKLPSNSEQKQELAAVHARRWKTTSFKRANPLKTLYEAVAIHKGTHHSQRKHDIVQAHVVGQPREERSIVG